MFGRNLCKFTFPQRRRNLRKSLLDHKTYGRKKGQKMAALKITLAKAWSVNAQMLENRVRRLASKDLRGVLRQRKWPHKAGEN